MELILQLTYFKLKMPDFKSFINKKEEYKSWKWDIYNKFIWKLGKFNIDRY